MAREVTHEAHGPLYLDEDDIDEKKGDIAVCPCGFSGDYPFCDGSHRATEDEEAGVRYSGGQKAFHTGRRHAAGPVGYRF